MRVFRLGIKERVKKYWQMRLLDLVFHYKIFFQLDLNTEQDNFGDLLQHDFHDSYMNLTLKSVFMLKWLRELQNPKFGSMKHRIIPKLVLKIDDDVFVNANNLFSALRKVEWSRREDGEKYLVLG